MLLATLFPVFGAIIIPGLGLLALILLPYLDQDMDTIGIWFRSIWGRVLTGLSFLLGVVGTFGCVWLDEKWLDFPGWLPFLPRIISNGWVPLPSVGHK